MFEIINKIKPVIADYSGLTSYPRHFVFLSTGQDMQVKLHYHRVLKIKTELVTPVMDGVDTMV